MINLLKKTKELVGKMQATSSSLDKVSLLKDYLFSDPSLQKLFLYVHHPLHRYNVTSSNCKKNKFLRGKTFNSIFDLLDALRNREITGHEAIGSVNSFCEKFLDYQDLIYTIIDKDLKIRAGDKLINKAIPNLIPEFQVALSEEFKPSVANFAKERWYASRKMDGVRCIAVVDSRGNSIFYSRTGKIFDTLGKLEETIKNSGVVNCVLDGELCLVDENGQENFQDVMKELHKKNYLISNPSYKLFDLLTHNEFFAKKGDKGNVLENRLSLLKKAFSSNNSRISVLEQIKIKDQEHFAELIKESQEKLWEGLIIRKDTEYKGKRSKDLLKCKSFHDKEYVVNDVEYGPFRYVLEGKEQEDLMLSCVMINHKGNVVRVGSGFTIDQRKEFFKDSSKILGKLITVQFFEETKNQDGGISLRFPTFKYVYEGKRDT